MKNLGKKMGLVFATTAVGVTMFASISGRPAVRRHGAFGSGIFVRSRHNVLTFTPRS